MFYVIIKIILYIEILWKISKFKIHEIEANISGTKLSARNDYIQFWCNIKLYFLKLYFK